MLLPELVTAIDGALQDPGENGTAENALLRVTGEPPQLEVACRPLHRTHPLEVVLGFTAPSPWWAFGLRGRALARRLEPDHPDPRPVVVTMLITRDGHGTARMRHGPEVTDLPGVPEGVLGDALRRSMGLPTAPAPETTVDLWLRIWLDRLVETVTGQGEAGRYRNWDEVATLHPAGTIASSWQTVAPVALADATVRLAEAWPWARLRHDPEVADTAHPPPPRRVTTWMDDGMFARWCLADLPGFADLADAVDALLPASINTAIADTVRSAGLTWPPDRRAPAAGDPTTGC